MIRAQYFVVAVDPDVKNNGKYRRVELADVDGDGVIPARPAESLKELPKPLTKIDAELVLTGFSKPAKSTRTGNDYVATQINAELRGFKVAA